MRTPSLPSPLLLPFATLGLGWTILVHGDRAGGGESSCVHGTCDAFHPITEEVAPAAITTAALRGVFPGAHGDGLVREGLESGAVLPHCLLTLLGPHIIESLQLGVKLEGTCRVL